MPKKTTNTKKTTAKPRKTSATKKSAKGQDVGSVFAPEGGWKNLLTGETLRFIVGLVLLLLALFAIVAMCSLYSSAAHDQAVYEGAAREYHNWGGSLGAKLAHTLVVRYFGVCSLLIPIFLVQISMKIMGAYKVRIWKWFLNLGFIMVWGSVALSVCSSEFFPASLRDVPFKWGGEHGDSEFVPLSQVMLATKQVSEILEDGRNSYCADDMKKIEEQVRTAAYKIIEAKRATYYGIGMAITRIVKAILGDENSVLTVSAKLCGEYESRNVFIGVPSIIGRNGVKEVLELSLTDEEMEKFRASAKILDESFEGLKM